jgi:hypothetical protein
MEMYGLMSFDKCLYICVQLNGTAVFRKVCF